MPIELTDADRQNLVFFLQQGLNHLGSVANGLGARLSVPDPEPQPATKPKRAAKAKP